MWLAIAFKRSPTQGPSVLSGWFFIGLTSTELDSCRSRASQKPLLVTNTPYSFPVFFLFLSNDIFVCLLLSPVVFSSRVLPQQFRFKESLFRSTTFLRGVILTCQTRSSGNKFPSRVEEWSNIRTPKVRQYLANRYSFAVSQRADSTLLS